jgi:prophage regulatory protein
MRTTEHTRGPRNQDRVSRATELLREAIGLLADQGDASSSLSRAPSDRLLRLPEVQRLTGLGRSAIYEQMSTGSFPRSIKVGSRSVSWSEAAVQAWIAKRLSSNARSGG